jgi:multidrug efflux pump subunit AcrA (membrane-fusion protein)
MLQFIARAILVLFLVAVGLGTAIVSRDLWLPWLGEGEKPPQEAPHEHADVESVTPSPQALASLGIRAERLTLSDYPISVTLPGTIIDKPGVSDRGVPAPVGGIVTRIHVEPGRAVTPGEVLFTLRVNSEYLQNAQTELFKTASEMVLNRKQRERLSVGGIVPEARLLELDQAHSRLEVAARAHRHDLLSRGLTTEQIEEVEKGNLIREMTVLVPSLLPNQKPLASRTDLSLAYEVQELKVELGQQVQPGQLLAYLANHHSLLIEGRAFAKEAALIEEAARMDASVEVEFLGDDPSRWANDRQSLKLSYISNMYEPGKKLLVFHLPLVNKEEPIERRGRQYLLWRYRPGQRVRLKVPYREEKQVFVVPASAVVREGIETYVFRQNDEAYDRKRVQLIHLNSTHAVLGQESEVAPGQKIAWSGAAALNRILKAQAGEGEGHHHDHGH